MFFVSYFRSVFQPVAFVFLIPLCLFTLSLFFCSFSFRSCVDLPSHPSTSLLLSIYHRPRPVSLVQLLFSSWSKLHLFLLSSIESSQAEFIPVEFHFLALITHTPTLLTSTKTKKKIWPFTQCSSGWQARGRLSPRLHKTARLCPPTYTSPTSQARYRSSAGSLSLLRKCVSLTKCFAQIVADRWLASSNAIVQDTLTNYERG